MPPVNTEEVNFMKEVVTQLATLNTLVRRLDESIEAIEKRNQLQMDSIMSQTNSVTAELWSAMNECRRDMSNIQAENAGTAAVGRYKVFLGRVLAGVLVLAVGSTGTFVTFHERAISQMQTEVKWIEKHLDK
jgi:hypothetical protein